MSNYKYGTRPKDGKGRLAPLDREDQVYQHTMYHSEDSEITSEEARNLLALNLENHPDTNLCMSMSRIAQGVYGVMEAAKEKFSPKDRENIVKEFSEVHEGMNEIVERMLRAEVELAKLKANQEKILTKMDDLSEIRERVRNFNLVEIK
jgi:predicted nuclease with TOPRIM domain